MLLVVTLGLAACGGGGGSSLDTAVASTGSISRTSDTSSSSSTVSKDSADSNQVITGNGSFSLSWTAPVARSDGSALSLAEIAGFKIYYGTSPGNYTKVYNQGNGAATSATVNSLASGTYYVAMSTYDTTGREGVLSPQVTRLVP